MKNHWVRFGLGFWVLSKKVPKKNTFSVILLSGFEFFSNFGFYRVRVLEFLNLSGSGFSGLEEYFGFGFSGLGKPDPSLKCMTIDFMYRSE